MKLILQTSGSYEVRTLLTHCMTRDIRFIRASMTTLREWVGALEEGAVPVGSVEFVRHALDLLRVNEPRTISYPKLLEPWFFRNIQCIAKHSVPRTESIFVKPAGQTKAFSGFVLGEKAADPSQAEYNRQQQEDFERLPAPFPVYVCSPMRFLSEWRYYVLDGKIVGKARYDDGEEDAIAPADATVRQMIAAYQYDPHAPKAYAIDAGVLDVGVTALVEVNDAWGLGLYRGMDNTQAYLEMLAFRWHEIWGRAD